MTFFDTNMLVYFTINQDADKLIKAQKYIFEAIEKDMFFISPLVMSEYIYVLSKYKIDKIHEDKIRFFSQYMKSSMDNDTVLLAYDLCSELNFCKNINDAIHLKVAEKSCSRLVTFDGDFKKLQPYTDIDIQILA